MSRLTALIGRPGIRTGDYMVTRTAAPAIAEGLAVSSSTSTFQTGDASLQVLSGKDLELLPVGLSSTDSRKLFTTAELRLVPVPDIVTIEGEPWTVFHIDGPHVGRGGRHSVVYLARRMVP